MAENTGAALITDKSSRLVKDWTVDISPYECVIVHPGKSMAKNLLKKPLQRLYVDYELKEPASIILGPVLGKHPLFSRLPRYLVCSYESSILKLKAEAIGFTGIISWDNLQQHTRSVDGADGSAGAQDAEHFAGPAKFSDIAEILKTIITADQMQVFEGMKDFFHEEELFAGHHLYKAAASVDSLSESVKECLDDIHAVSGSDILAVVIEHRDSRFFISRAYGDLSDDQKNDFLNMAFHSHFSQFHGSDPSFFIHQHVKAANIGGNKESAEGAADNNSAESMVMTDAVKDPVSSYYTAIITNISGSHTGTLHLGSLRNNYFSNSGTRGIIDERVVRNGVIISNAVEFEAAARQQNAVYSVFAKFVPEQVIEKLCSDEEIENKAERSEVCILFSDIRSFTTITEKNSAEQVVGFLNRYFESMVSCIREEGGVIDKFIGDAIVALFGVPDIQSDFADRALRAALKMKERLPAVDVDNMILPGGQVKNGIGIHLGESIVGTVGSSSKKAYTTIGNTAAIAEELEAMTKGTASGILISEQVKERLTGNYSLSVYCTSEAEEGYPDLYTVNLAEQDL